MEVRNHPDIPEGAWDTHIHVFDPQKWPYASNRRYTPAPASLDQYPHRSTGCTNLVIVHASMQGSSPAPLVDALGHKGHIQGQTLRGLATLDFERLTDDDLDRLHAAGVRGTRMHLMTGQADISPDSVSKSIESIAPRLGRLGWVLDLFMPLSTWAGMAEFFSRLDPRIKVVADHFGAARPGDEDKPEFKSFLDLVSERVYVKLAAFERLYGAHPDGVDSLAPVAEAIIKAGPDRIMYASDWPHTQFSSYRRHKTPEEILNDVEPFRHVANEAHIAKLRTWVKKDDVWRKLWVNNPNSVFQ
ncbi:uncharacterized protein PV09_08033 [Verruconis gallopava]|uniref:Amidohydrolase-related domain-containing protein n=1 Tax=Verruconis gallopava TaxID=253628 RepID=A0A0D1YI73_9PEZI|nr:uncharacterized protein PV09_08033 [Verruconis gallopava]KIW00517.1 hypothetical protein PV09_08033 [Verruconis gallopava]